MSDLEPATKRCRKNWIRVDTQGIPIEKYIANSKYKWVKSSKMSGKQYHKCKLYHHFGYKHEIRTFMIDNIEVLEECGSHIYDDPTNEKLKTDLCARVKQKVTNILDDTPNAKPGKVFEKLIFKEYNKYAFKEKYIQNFMKGLCKYVCDAAPVWQNIYGTLEILLAIYTKGACMAKW